MHNEVVLNMPSGISVAIDDAIRWQEGLGHSRTEILQQPLFGEIVDAVMGRLVLRPDTHDSRHIARLHVITELGSRQ